jgi:PST family polysaccharide transporter
MDSTHVARGAAFTLAARATSQVLQFSISVVLARLIAPDAFGLVAMTATFTGFVALFVDGGLSTAIVQSRELSDEQLDACFATALLLGVVLSCVVLLGAPFVARFYDRAVLVGLTRVSAGAILAAALGAVPRAILVRRLQVRSVALVELAIPAASGAIALTLAGAGAGVWALAISQPAAALAGAIAFFAIARWRPRPPSSLAGAGPLLRIGFHLVGFAVVNYWARNIDNVLVGARLGEMQLGFYVRAYALMLLPISEITGVLSTTMLPVLSRLQHDDAAARAVYLKVLGLVGFVAFPAMVGLSLVAEPFVAIVFGPMWAPVAPLLRVLALVGAIQAVVNPVGWLYQSRGRTDRLFRWGMFASAVFVAAIAAGAALGSAVRVAELYLLANVVLFVPAYAYGGCLVSLRVRTVLAVLLPPALGCAVMALAVEVVDAVATSAIPPAARLGADAVVGVAAYAIACRALRVPAMADAVDLAAAVAPRWAPWCRRARSSEAAPGGTDHA